MAAWGAECVASPDTTGTGRRSSPRLDPRQYRHLGAVEDAVGRGDTKMLLGGVLSHVLLHQTIIGREAQMEMAGDSRRRHRMPCGGSNCRSHIPAITTDHQGKTTRTSPSSPSPAPTLTQTLAYDYGDTGR